MNTERSRELEAKLREANMQIASRGLSKILEDLAGELPEYLPLKAAAALFGCRPASLRARVHLGRAPGSYRIGGRYFIHLAELRDRLVNHCHPYYLWGDGELCIDLSRTEGAPVELRPVKIVWP